MASALSSSPPSPGVARTSSSGAGAGALAHAPGNPSAPGAPEQLIRGRNGGSGIVHSQQGGSGSGSAMDPGAVAWGAAPLVWLGRRLQESGEPEALLASGYCAHVMVCSGA